MPFESPKVMRDYYELLETMSANYDKDKEDVEEFPPLPHKSWRWKLSLPAKELEHEFIVLIKRYLQFRKFEYKKKHFLNTIFTVRHAEYKYFFFVPRPEPE